MCRGQPHQTSFFTGCLFGRSKYLPRLQRSRTYRTQRSQDRRSQRYWLAVTLDFHAGASEHLKEPQGPQENCSLIPTPSVKVRWSLTQQSWILFCSLPCLKRIVYHKFKNYWVQSVKAYKYMLFTLKKIKTDVGYSNKSSHQENNVCLPYSFIKVIKFKIKMNNFHFSSDHIWIASWSLLLVCLESLDYKMK